MTTLPGSLTLFKEDAQKFKELEIIYSDPQLS